MRGPREPPSSHSEVDTTRINAYTWIGPTCEGGRKWDGERPGPLLHQRGGPDARHASADAAKIRASWTRAAVAHDRQHAALFARRARTAQVDQAPGRRCRNQPGGGAAATLDREDRRAPPPADARRHPVGPRRPAPAPAGARRTAPHRWFRLMTD